MSLSVQKKLIKLLSRRSINRMFTAEQYNILCGLICKNKPQRNRLLKRWNRVLDGSWLEKVFGFFFARPTEDWRAPEVEWFKLSGFKNREKHAPFYNWLGPGTYIDQRLERGDKPVDALDVCAMKHDLVYNRTDLTDEDVMRADKEFLKCLNNVNTKDKGKKYIAFIATQIFAGKLKLHKLGLLKGTAFTSTV